MFEILAERDGNVYYALRDDGALDVLVKAV
jgi:hypothetical protein